MTDAEAQDLIRRTVLQVLQELGILSGDDPRPGEGRSSAWRGVREDDTESMDPTNTDESGESCSLDLMGDKLWSRFQKKAKRPRRKQPRSGDSQE